MRQSLNKITIKVRMAFIVNIYYHIIIYCSILNLMYILVRLSYRPYKELSLKGVVFQSKKRGRGDIGLLKTKVM